VRLALQYSSGPIPDYPELNLPVPDPQEVEVELVLEAEDHSGIAILLDVDSDMKAEVPPLLKLDHGNGGESVAGLHHGSLRNGPLVALQIVSFQLPFA